MRSSINIGIWFPLYLSDFWLDVDDFSDKEIVIYLKLLTKFWRNPESLINDDKTLAKLSCVSKQQWLRSRESILALFFLDDGKWYSKALHSEIPKAKLKGLKNKRNAYLKHGNMDKACEIQQEIDGYLAKNSLPDDKNDTANALRTHMRKHCHTQSQSQSQFLTSTPPLDANEEITTGSEEKLGVMQ